MGGIVNKTRRLRPARTACMLCFLSVLSTAHAQTSWPGRKATRSAGTPIPRSTKVRDWGTVRTAARPPEQTEQATAGTAQTQPSGRPREIAPRVQIPQVRTAQDVQPRRLDLLPRLPKELADPPKNGAAQAKFNQFVKRTIDPELTMDLIVGRPRILEFKETPTRIYLAQESVASYDILSDTEIAISGVSAGRTVLTIWVNDDTQPGGQRVLSYLLRVSEDAGYRVRLESVFKALEKEINRDFPDSFVKLSLIGDQVVVRGQAKDVVEAAQIIRIVNEHSPPARSRNRDNRPTNLSISQTAYSADGALQSSEELGFALNSLTDLAELEGESNVINLLSIPGEQQVMLRVTVAEVNRSALRAIGARLRLDGNSSRLDGAFPPRLVDLTSTSLMVLEGGTMSVARGDFKLTVDALKQHNLAKTLAEPNLVTLHGRPARFQAGGQFPVPAARVGFGSAGQGVDFIPFGVQLQFVPFIIDRDKIRLSVAANVSTRDEAISTDVGGSNVPGLNTRNFQNTVELREGQTLAVAGLIQTNFGSNSSRVPGLGDLPGLGRFFKSDATSADEQELVILITPELVSPVDSGTCLPAPGADMFEPDDVEFYLNGAIEGLSRRDYRSVVRTDWDRIAQFHDCEDALIIGPSGHCYGSRSQAGSHTRVLPRPQATMPMPPQTVHPPAAPTAGVANIR